MKFLDRRIALLAIPLAAVFGGAQPAAALSVTVNGQTVTFAPAPLSRAGRVFVPLRGVFERLGASVVYDRGTINATGNNHAISLRIGSTAASIDGRPRLVDVAPFIVGASTYVPLRFISQALGAGVNYDAANQIVALTTPAQGAPVAPPPPVASMRVENGPGRFFKNIAPARAGNVLSRKPTISADFRRPVDPNSVHIALDGADVTPGATRSTSGFVYAPPSPLQSMRHTVEAGGTLADGGPFLDRWSFTSGSQPPSNSLSISAPADGDSVAGTFTISGKTVANASVHIVAGATARVGGVFVFGTGSYTGDLQADPSGYFTQRVSLQTVGGAEIGVTITSTDPRSKESAQKKLRLRAQ